MGKTYMGNRNAQNEAEVVVVQYVPFGVTALAPRFDLYNHSPTGFEWGYGGSGPAQLSLALLADHLADHADEVKIIERTFELDWLGEGVKPSDRAALRLYQGFKFAVIGGLPRAAAWRLTTAEVSAKVIEMCSARAEARCL